MREIERTLGGILILNIFTIIPGARFPISHPKREALFGAPPFSFRFGLALGGSRNRKKH